MGGLSFPEVKGGEVGRGGLGEKLGGKGRKGEGGQCDQAGK